MTTLENLCLEIVDCEHKTAPIDETGSHFAVGTPAMRGNVINFGEARRISEETFKAWTRRLTPRSGDLLFAREAPVGPVVRIPDTENVAPGQRTVLMRPDPRKAHSRFLYYLLSSRPVQGRLQDLAAGSTVAHLNVADVRSFALDVPDLPTQEAVADVLGALDDKIAANDRVVKQSDELSRAVLTDAVRGIGRVSLGELAALRRGMVTPGAGDVWHFSLPAFDDGVLPKLEPGAEIKSGKQLLEAPTVLLSKLNPRIPRVWDVASVPVGRPALASTEFLALEPQGGSTSVLAAALGLPSSLEDLQSLARGTSGSHQRVAPGDALAVMVPDVRELPSATRDLLTTLGLGRQQRRLEARSLAATRDALLPELMSGRLAVSSAS